MRADKQEYPALSPAQVKAVRSVPGPLRVPPLHANFSVRLAAHKPTMNKNDCRYGLTPAVRALLKDVSACGLRPTIRPRAGGFVHTHDTRYILGDQSTKWIGSPGVVPLDAENGAPTAHVSASLFHSVAVASKIATAPSWSLNTKLTGNVYVA